MSYIVLPPIHQTPWRRALSSDSGNDCEGGRVLDPDGECRCPQGQAFLDTQGICLPICREDQDFVPPFDCRCPDGEVDDGSACVPMQPGTVTTPVVVVTGTRGGVDAPAGGGAPPPPLVQKAAVPTGALYALGFFAAAVVVVAVVKAS